MNTNRSTTLGSKKAIKLFGPRKGAAVYYHVKRCNRQRALMKAALVPAEKVAAAFKHMATASKGAVMDFHEFARFLQHGPGVLRPVNPMPNGSAGVSVQDLTDLAQQYKYLHPGCDK